MDGRALKDHQGITSISSIGQKSGSVILLLLLFKGTVDGP